VPEVTKLTTRSWGPEGRGGVHRPLAVLVHGVTSSSRTWWRAGPALAERGYRVLAVDLRGHGSSPRPTAGQSVADLATDVAETVEAAAGPPVDLLVGHSLGALVALELVAAQLLDILKGIDAVGSDLRFTTGSIGGSSLLVGEMTVAGA